MSQLKPNTCFAGKCKWAKQFPNSMACSNPKSIKYRKLDKPCETCGRKPMVERAGCGACIGRGLYIYPVAYEQCDCNGYETSGENEAI